MFHNLLESMDTSEAASDTKGSTDAGKQTADSKSPSPLSAEVQKVSEDKAVIAEAASDDESHSVKSIPFAESKPVEQVKSKCSHIGWYITLL